MAVASLAELSGYFQGRGGSRSLVSFIASAGEGAEPDGERQRQRLHSGGPASLIIARGQGVPAYAFFHQAQISGTQGLVVSKKLVDIKDPAQLKGITVGRTQGKHAD